MSYCPFCDSLNSTVIASPSREKKRRRLCLNCNKRFCTYEISEERFKQFQICTNKEKLQEIIDRLQMLIAKY